MVKGDFKPEMLFNFEKYEIYQRALRYADRIYDITENYPQSEQFGLISQLRRASLSISLNIAEGFSKYHKKDKIKYYRIARGSIFECVPALKFSLKRNYIESKDHYELYQASYELARRISGLMKKIEKR